MTAQDILDRAYGIIREKGIHRGQYAVDANGNSCPTSEGEKFCSAGAIARASLDLDLWNTEAEYEALGRLQKLIDSETPSELGVVSITSWNDYYATDDQVLDTFRRLSTPTMSALEATVAA